MRVYNAEIFLLVPLGLLLLGGVSVFGLVAFRLRPPLDRVAACGVYASVTGILSFVIMAAGMPFFGVWAGIVQSFLTRLGFGTFMTAVSPVLPFALFTFLVFTGAAVGGWIGWWMTREK